MLRSSAELLHLEESEGPITPYWDPTLHRDERQRVELFHKLADLKILSFRVRARAFVGLFFLKNKDGMIRLIIDARPANRYHARPHTSLGSSSALSGIDLSDACLLLTSGVGHISEIHLCGAGSDVRDGYYQFSNHLLAEYFALQFKVKAGDFGVTEVYDPETDGLYLSSRTNRCGQSWRPCQWGGLGLSMSAQTHWNRWCGSLVLVVTWLASDVWPLS